MMHLLKNQKHKRKFLWVLIIILPLIIMTLHKTGHETADATLIGTDTKIGTEIKTGAEIKKDTKQDKPNETESNLLSSTETEPTETEPPETKLPEPIPEPMLEQQPAQQVTVPKPSDSKPKVELEAQPTSSEQAEVTTVVVSPSPKPPTPPTPPTAKEQPQSESTETKTEVQTTKNITAAKPKLPEKPLKPEEKPKPVKKMVDPRFDSLEVLASTKLPKRKVEIKHWQTDKGAQVYFVSAPEIPMLDIRLVFDAGSARDAYIPGLAYLANGMLGEGTKNLTSDQIAEQFESLGAKFSNGSYRDMAIASLRTLTDEKYLKPAVKLFTQVVTQANFPDDAITRVKNQILAGLQYIKQQPGKLAQQAFYSKLYNEHPYSTPKEGTEKSINSIKINHLQTFYKEYYVAKNLVIAMVGNITQEKAQQIANNITKPMNSGGHAEPLAKPTTIKKLHHQINFPSTQTHVYMGTLGLEKGNPDYPAIFVANHILGGSGFGSRLVENVREKQGLAYSVGSGFILMRAQGPFFISLQTKAKQKDKALAIVNKTLKRFIDEGPTEKELTDAKQNILGSFPLSSASNSSIVGQLGSIGFYQLPLNYLDKFMEGIQKVTTNDIKQIFSKYISPDNMLVVTVGPK